MNRIKEVLADKGIKQTWLAEKLGKSYNMVNSYVQNRQQPRLEVLFEIAKILDVDPKELIQSDMNKKTLSERDICTKFITPAIEKSGWDKLTQLLEEVSFTDGKIYVRGKLTARGARKRADYILYYKPNIPIAIVEAKDNKHSVQAGIQQALDYAKILDIPCVFSSNGDSFVFHDRTATDGNIETELDIDSFPSPEELWQKYKKYKGIETPEAEKVASQDYYFDGSGRSPRYYQQIAVNRTVEA